MTVPDTGLSRHRLILTRHAKSSWDNPLLNDHDRPLNRRGLRAAMELGEWLSSRGYLPEQVLCSTALRTCETWVAIERAPLEVLPDFRLVPELYNASSDVILSQIRRCTADTVMVLGHNPGIGELAARLAARAPSQPEFRKYPSAATLVVDFHVSGWNEITDATGDVMDFFLPAGKS